MQYKMYLINLSEVNPLKMAARVELTAKFQR